MPVVNKVCDYSPQSINRMLKDSLPIGSETPRQDDRNLFSGVVYNGKPDDESIFVKLYSVDFKVIKENDAVHLSSVERKCLDEKLGNFEEVFGEIDEPTPYAVHCINTGESQPILSPPYRLSFAKARELRTEIDKMLESDIIEECESSWASPVVMVPKRIGGVRVCVDYRKINAATIPDRYPLPRIDDFISLKVQFT